MRRKVEVFTVVGSNCSLNVAVIGDDASTVLWPLEGTVLVTTGGVVSEFEVMRAGRISPPSHPANNIKLNVLTRNRVERFTDCMSPRHLIC